MYFLSLQGPGQVDMMCRVLTSLDEDCISLDIPRSAEESRLSMAIKDALRETCIADIAEAWYRQARRFTCPAFRPYQLMHPGSAVCGHQKCAACEGNVCRCCWGVVPTGTLFYKPV